VVIAQCSLHIFCAQLFCGHANTAKCAQRKDDSEYDSGCSDAWFRVRVPAECTHGLIALVTSNRAGGPATQAGSGNTAHTIVDR
jgi:hypothetical protein